MHDWSQMTCFFLWYFSLFSFFCLFLSAPLVQAGDQRDAEPRDALYLLLQLVQARRCVILIFCLSCIPFDVIRTLSRDIVLGQLSFAVNFILCAIFDHFVFLITQTHAGAKVSNSLTVDQIKNISVLSSFRALSYLPLTQTLVLQSEALNQPLAMVVKVHDPESAQQVSVLSCFELCCLALFLFVVLATVWS